MKMENLCKSDKQILMIFLYESMNGETFLSFLKGVED